MASSKINEITGYVKNNKYVKNIYNKINNKLDTSEETTYYDYPTLSENQKNNLKIINGFIGMYCPMGYYSIKKNGTIQIIPDRKMLSQNDQMKKNLNNFTCAGSACNKSASNSNNIEGFQNHKFFNYKFFYYLLLLFIFLFIFYLFLKKKKV